MKKRDWAIAIAPLFLSWGLDRVTKQFATGIVDAKFYGVFGLVLHHNHGAMLGLFSDFPAQLRIVSLTTGGAFLLFLFAIIQFMLPSKIMQLRVGLSFLMGGILGNVTDKTIWGYVVDFLIFKFGSWYSPAFNVADAMQWIGYGFTSYALIKYGKDLWPANNLRKSYWINPVFQLKFCFVMLLVGAGVTVILGTFSFNYMKVALMELGYSNSVTTDKILTAFLVTFFIISLTFSAMLFVIGLMLSHRAAGPLYAFERFLNDYLLGKKAHLKLRAGDEFLHLQELADKLAEQKHPVPPSKQKHSA